MGWRQAILLSTLFTISCKDISPSNVRPNLAYIASAMAGSYKQETPAQYIQHNVARMARNVTDVTGLEVQVPPIEFRRLDVVEDGRYDEIENKIYLSVDLFDPTKTLYTFQKVDLDMILTHELAHAAVDQYSEHRGNGTWPKMGELQTEEDFIRVYGLRLIAEGISTHTIIQLYPQESRFSEWSKFWPVPIGLLGNMMFRNTMYDGGAVLVSDIIQEYGPRGIEELITNPPNVKSPKELPAYKQQILARLRQKI